MYYEVLILGNLDENRILAFRAQLKVLEHRFYKIDGITGFLISTKDTLYMFIEGPMKSVMTAYGLIGLVISIPDSALRESGLYVTRRCKNFYVKWHEEKSSVSNLKA